MKMYKSLLSILVVLLLATNAFSAPRIVCVENDGNSLKIRKQQVCLNAGGTPLDLAYLANRDKILCYGNIAAESVPPTVRSFGGSRTTNVTVERAIAGSYIVKCNGVYGDLSSSDDLTLSVSATDSDARDSASGNTDIGFLVSSTEIEFGVFTFTNGVDPSAGADKDFSFIILGDLNN